MRKKYKANNNLRYLNAPKSATISSIKVSVNNKNMMVGESQHLNVVVSPNKTPTCDLVWSSSDRSVASVNINSELVYASEVGIATIRVSSAENLNTVGECTIIVTNGYTYPTSSKVLARAYSSAHRGIDIFDKLGAPIRAFADGVVAYSQTSCLTWIPRSLNDENYSEINQGKATMGTCTVINHYNPMTDIYDGKYARTIYMHMDVCPTLSAGMPVRKGDIIGYNGSSDRTYGPHLHFSLLVGNDERMRPGDTGWWEISMFQLKNPCTVLSAYEKLIVD